MTDEEPPELYRRHRPRSLKTFYGNESAKKVLEDLISRKKIPHACIFTGPSGCGKTTLARLIAKTLGAEGRALQEVNVAISRGLDEFREINTRMTAGTITGGARCYILDEVHAATREAQTAMLKMLEDPPDHVYFLLCTTDPQKLLPTIRTRCTEIKVESLPDDLMKALLRKIAAKENRKLADKVADKIVEVSDGSAREAVKNLAKVIGLKSEKDQLDALLRPSVKTQAVEIARELMAFKGGKPKWDNVRKVLKDLLENENPESLRAMICSYAASCCLNGAKHGQAYRVLEAFSSPAYQKFDLVRMAYEAVVVFE